MAEEIEKVVVEKIEAGLQKRREVEHKLDAMKAKLGSMHPVQEVVDKAHRKAEGALKEVRELEAEVKDAVDEARERAADKYVRWRPALEFTRLHPVVSSAGVASAVALPMLVLFKAKYVVKPALLSGLVAYAGIKSGAFLYRHLDNIIQKRNN